MPYVRTLARSRQNSVKVLPMAACRRIRDGISLMSTNPSSSISFMAFSTLLRIVFNALLSSIASTLPVTMPPCHSLGSTRTPVDMYLCLPPYVTSISITAALLLVAVFFLLCTKPTTGILSIKPIIVYKSLSSLSSSISSHVFSSFPSLVSRLSPALSQR